MADTIEALAAKAEITELLHRYALNVRRRQHDLCAELFTEDCSFEVRDAHPMHPETLTTRSFAEGREAVVVNMGASRETARVFPAIHNLLIALDGDTASASSLMVALVFPGGGEILGEYEDHFRREHGMWLFTSRCYTIYRES